MSMQPTDPRQESGRRPDGRFAPGNNANPKGRTPGSRNRATAAAQALLDGEVEALTRKAVELAMEGDTTALRLCLERIVPARKEAPLPPLSLPTVNSIQDLPALTEAILQAVAAGELTPTEAQGLASLAATHAKSLEIAGLEQRLAAIESQLAQEAKK